MVFGHLENMLAEGDNKNAEEYLDVFLDLKEPTRTVLGYTLDIASFLNSSGLDKEYVIFGGYAVLSHIMDIYGEQMAKVWRGSNDIDMAGTQSILRVIKSGYEVNSDFPSQNLKDKRTLKLVEDNEKECKIDFYTGDFKKRFSSERNRHFGIDVIVGNPISLIHSKANIPVSEATHSYDILTLLAVLEHRGYSPKDILKEFRGNERALLFGHVKEGLKKFGEDRIGFFPSGKFNSTLKTQLHKFRGV